ncbi:uncharacterized protein LOC143232611 [Tachypleus tridentatus]|uniref:uncharacterized protein LOC143232611 n=1 Tax=Tachypleus tridentatus TaxID=6853 RepID=UPI003FCEF7F6
MGTPNLGCMLPFIACFLSVLSIILQLVALPSNYWAIVHPSNDSEAKAENGNYGIWTRYIRHIPRTGDQFPSNFRLPPYSVSAGVMAIIHVLVQLAFLVAAGIRCIQVSKDDPQLLISANILGVVKLVLSILAISFSLLVIIFITVNENQSYKYKVYKGPAFWIQTAVMSSNVLLAFVCSLEDIEHAELESIKNIQECPSETEVTEQYSNPSFTP